MTERPKAYSYLRFSTPEQEQGDSYRRQTEMAEEHARKHGLELDTELKLQDRAVSAYRGKNADVPRGLTAQAVKVLHQQERPVRNVPGLY